MKAKGSVILSTIEFVKNNFGDAGFKEVLSYLPDKYSDLISLKIATTMWYDFELYKQLTDGVIELFFEGDVKAARKIGAFTAERGMTTAHKVFYKIGTPRYIIMIANKIFSTYFSNGHFKVLKSSKRDIHIKLYGLDELYQAHIERILGWMVRAFELTGAKNPQSKVIEMKDTPEEKYVIYLGSWDSK